MTTDDVSRHSWTALGGLAILLMSVLAGVSVAPAFGLKNDDALCAGLYSGGLVGLCLGGLVVGFIHARSKADRPQRLISWLVAPGFVIGVPLCGSGLLNRELVEPLRQLLLLGGLSGVMTEVGRALATAKRGLAARSWDASPRAGAVEQRDEADKRSSAVP